MVLSCKVAEQLTDGSSEPVITNVMKDDVIEWVEPLPMVHKVEHKDHPFEEKLLKGQGQSSHGTKTTKEGENWYGCTWNQAP